MPSTDLPGFPPEDQSPLRNRLAAAAAARENAPLVVELLAAAYPEARTSLQFSSLYQLLLATVLSAQTTDQRVNQVTPELFRRWPDPPHLAGASEEELMEVIGSLGLASRKAAALRGIGVLLVEKFDSQVPGTLAELVQLPGVGRKTAHVALGNWFGEQKITVDTHVRRVVRRLGWSDQTSPVKVEEDLLELLPEAPWTQLSHRLIAHGRAVCRARRPVCSECILRELCPQLNVTNPT